MAQEDQQMRLGDIEKIDWSKQHEIDKRNLIRIKQIVQEFGCITISKFSRETSENAWLIIQHAVHDLDFMEYYCKLMEDNFDDIVKSNFAKLKDRTLVHRNRAQLYGTHFSRGPKEVHFHVDEIEDIENVDKRRSEVGLGTLKESILVQRRSLNDTGIEFPKGYKY